MEEEEENPSHARHSLPLSLAMMMEEEEKEEEKGPSIKTSPSGAILPGRVGHKSYDFMAGHWSLKNELDLGKRQA